MPYGVVVVSNRRNSRRPDATRESRLNLSASWCRIPIVSRHAAGARDRPLVSGFSRVCAERRRRDVRLESAARAAGSLGRFAAQGPATMRPRLAGQRDTLEVARNPPRVLLVERVGAVGGKGGHQAAATPWTNAGACTPDPESGNRHGDMGLEMPMLSTRSIQRSRWGVATGAPPKRAARGRPRDSEYPAR